MPKIIKRSGEAQDFDRAKVEDSLRKAGATDELARRVAERIRSVDGIASDQLRKRVAEELRKERPDIAEAYIRTVRLKARAKPELAAGTVRVPTTLPRIPDLAPSPRARVGFGNKWAVVDVERALNAREIWLSQTDLRKLGASEGARIALHFPREAAPPTAHPGPYTPDR